MCFIRIQYIVQITLYKHHKRCNANVQLTPETLTYVSMLKTYTIVY